MTQTNHLIAAYTAAPADEGAAERYYADVVENAWANTLGLGWKGTASGDEIAARTAVLPDHWGIAVNAVPGTFRAWSADHRFGLASPDDEGRRAAVAMVGEIAATAARVADVAGRPVLRHVEVHAAPGFTDRTHVADARALHASLHEIAAFEWSGAEVSLEHCDAFVPGRTPAKGFLGIDEEIALLTRLDGVVGLSLNWGRSIIETRSPEGVVAHIDVASKSGLLRGITFSGTADSQTGFGPAWADSHLALADGADGFEEPASLLTTARVAESVEASGSLRFVGAKTNWRLDRADPLERARSVVANHRAIRAAAQHMTTH